MKKDPTHQILNFTENETPLHIAPHKGKQGHGIEATLWHDQIEIKLFYSDGEELVIGNDLYITEKNDIFVINSCEPHSTQKTSENTDYHMLIIDIAKLPTTPDSKIFKIISNIITGELSFKNRIKNSSKLKTYIEDLVENQSKNNNEFDLQTAGLTFLILNELVTNYSVMEKPWISRKNAMTYTQKLSPAIKIINEKYSQKISLASLAEACGLNEKYFCRVFKNLTGMTAVEYINKLRINKAETLITTTDMALWEIAESCGFSELSYFSKKFRDIKGYSPTNARKTSNTHP